MTDLEVQVRRSEGVLKLQSIELEILGNKVQL